MQGSEIIKVIPFEFEGKNYEIRIESDGVTLFIRAFYKEKPANGFSYQVDHLTNFSLKKLIEYDAIEDLVTSAKEDILKKRWESLLKARKTVNNN